MAGLFGQARSLKRQDFIQPDASDALVRYDGPMRLATAKVADRFVLLCASVCMVAKQYTYPDKEFWTKAVGNKPYVVVILVIVIGVFGATTPLQSLTSRGSGERRTALRQQILTHYGRMVTLAVQANPGAEISDLGLHIWKIQRPLNRLFRSRLVRLATYRLGSTPQTRAFSPMRGVGVVGLCWKRNEEVAVNVEELNRSLVGPREFDQYKASMGTDAVMGFTWEEFKRVSHRGAVFASPVRDKSGKFAGCVSVDLSSRFDEMNVGSFWHELNALCLELGRDGYQYV